MHAIPDVRKNLLGHFFTRINVSSQRISVTKCTPGYGTQIHHLSIIVLAPDTSLGQVIGSSAPPNGKPFLTRNIVVSGFMEYQEQAKPSWLLT